MYTLSLSIYICVYLYIYIWGPAKLRVSPTRAEVNSPSPVRAEPGCAGMGQAAPSRAKPGRGTPIRVQTLQFTSVAGFLKTTCLVCAKRPFWKVKLSQAESS